MTDSQAMREADLIAGLRAWASIRDKEALAEPVDWAKRSRTAMLRDAADALDAHRAAQPVTTQATLRHGETVRSRAIGNVLPDRCPGCEGGCGGHAVYYANGDFAGCSDHAQPAAGADALADEIDTFVGELTLGVWSAKELAQHGSDLLRRAAAALRSRPKADETKP